MCFEPEQKKPKTVIPIEGPRAPAPVEPIDPMAPPDMMGGDTPIGGHAGNRAVQGGFRSAVMRGKKKGMSGGPLKTRGM